MPLTRTVGGVRLVSTERLATIMTTDTDRVLGVPVAKCLGYFSGLPDFGGRTGVFGCKGSGGSVAFADPGRDFAVAFTHNRMAAPPEDLAASITGHVRDALTAAR